MLENPFEKFLHDVQQANPDHTVTSWDVIHMLSQEQQPSAELVFALQALFMPEFILKDNKIFIADTFDQQEYINHGEKAQFWLNLIELTSLFENIEVDVLIELGQKISQNWNYIISAKFPDAIGQARMIHEIYAEEQHEVYLTVDAQQLIQGVKTKNANS